MASNRLSTEVEAAMKQIRVGLWLMAIGVSLLVGVTYVHAEEVRDQKEWVWGCYIHGRSLDGTCILRRFTKVGEADNDVDTNEERVLGFEPGNVPMTRDGQPIYSRVKSVMFLTPGQTKMYSAAQCTCSSRR